LLGEGFGSDEALTQSIAQIRRALQAVGHPRAVETLAKRGYRLQDLPGARSSEASSTGGRMLRVAGSATAVALVLLLIGLTMIGPHTPRHYFHHLLGLGPPPKFRR
jgi:DNA-binding winged helix-turn-helix (wHTH) protein